MTYSILALLILLAMQRPEAIAQRDDQSSTHQFKVGMMTRSFEDDKRKNWQGTAARPLRTAIWYPAAATATKEETIFGGAPETEVFTPLTVAPAADISTARRKYPLILLSHGTGGSAIQIMWLGYYLAARGYIVAAVNHHGNTGAEKQLPGPGVFSFFVGGRKNKHGVVLLFF